jgi:prolyl oligopeptidase
MYPQARRDDIVDELFGHRIPDPYRWMEDAASAETQAWLTAQDELAQRVLGGIGDRDRFRSRLSELLAAGSVGLPVVRGERAFFARRLPDQQLPVLLVREPDGSERVLLDPSTMSDDDTVTLDGYVPSIEGELVGVWTSEGGDEESSLRIIDVASGQVVEGPIDRTRYSPLAWFPGGQEYVYGRRLPPDQVPAGEEAFHRRVYRHRLGAPTENDTMLFGDGREKTEYHSLHLSNDGRWLTISASAGTAPRNDVYLLDVTGGGDLVTVQERVDAETHAGVFDGVLYLFTNHEAPRFRIATADPASPAIGGWTTLVAESEAVLVDYAITDDALVVASASHAVGRLHVHDRATGALRGEVPLPDVGTIAGATSTLEGGDHVWVGYTDFTTPLRVLRYTVSTAELETWAAAPGAPSISGLTSEQVIYRSKDGTDVTMFLLHREGLVRDGSHPTVLYGYGGFNIALAPEYNASALAWAEAGGVWAIANLRGGSEEGEAWHRAGMREHKQNVFDDFIAAGEWLVTQRYTTRDRLGIYGGSNGGLLVGAALTQRPDLFAAVVCSAPLLDMVRYERFGLGLTWNDEYGTAADPTELGWLLGYSPYHRVVEGTEYPSVLFTVFDSDTRVDPVHVRKMAAALQHATTASPDQRPIVVRREGKVGHGARSVNRSVELGADVLAWFADRLGLAG